MDEINENITLDDLIDIAGNDQYKITRITRSNFLGLSKGEKIVQIRPAVTNGYDQDGDLSILFTDGSGDSTYIDTGRATNRQFYLITGPKPLEKDEIVLYRSKRVGVVAVVGTKVCISYVNDGVPDIAIVSITELSRETGADILMPKGVERALTAAPAPATDSIEF